MLAIALCNFFYYKIQWFVKQLTQIIKTCIFLRCLQLICTLYMSGSAIRFVSPQNFVTVRAIRFCAEQMAPLLIQLSII